MFESDFVSIGHVFAFYQLGKNNSAIHPGSSKNKPPKCSILFDEGLKALKCMIPLRSDYIQILLQRFERLWIQLVETLSAVFDFRDKPHIFQHGEVLGDGLTADLGSFRQSGNGMRLSVDQLCDQ